MLWHSTWHIFWRSNCQNYAAELRWCPLLLNLFRFFRYRFQLDTWNIFLGLTMQMSKARVGEWLSKRRCFCFAYCGNVGCFSLKARDVKTRTWMKATAQAFQGGKHSLQDMNFG